MSQINMNSITSKVVAWSKSPEGKKRMKQSIDDAIQSGKSRLESGDRLITTTDMIDMATEMIRMLRDEAAHFDNMLPQSVLDHFASLTHTQPIQIDAEGRQFSIDIYFGDDLSRMSLLIVSGENKGKRTGDGIDNIVSLYDTGYKTRRRVYGVWDGHENDGVIASRTKLEGRYFIERAVEAFNRKNGKEYRVEAKVISPEFYSSFNF